LLSRPYSSSNVHADSVAQSPIDQLQGDFRFGAKLHLVRNVVFFSAHRIVVLVQRELENRALWLSGLKGIGLRVPLLVRRERRAFSAGAISARQLSFQPVAIGAAMEVTISSKPSMEKGRIAAQRVGRP